MHPVNRDVRIIKCQECGKSCEFNLLDILDVDYLYCNSEDCEHILDADSIPEYGNGTVPDLQCKSAPGSASGDRTLNSDS